MVRVLASHQCVPSSIPGLHLIPGLLNLTKGTPLKKDKWHQAIRHTRHSFEADRSDAAEDREAEGEGD